MKLIWKLLASSSCLGITVGTTIGVVNQGGEVAGYGSSTTPTSYSYINPFNIKAADGIRDIEVSIDSFRDALRRYGATESNPMQIDFITPYSSLGPLNTTMYNRIGTEISQTLSGGLMSWNWLPAGTANPSASSWFSTGNSEMGFFLWGPDYDGVGTWISSWIGLDEWGNNNRNSLNVWDAVHKRIRDIYRNESSYLAQYGQKYVAAAKDLLSKLISAGLYKSSFSTGTNLPDDYRQAFEGTLGQSSGNNAFQGIFTDSFFGQHLTEDISFFLQYILDDLYLFMPTPTASLKSRSATLLDPQFIQRSSPYGLTNLRDSAVKAAGTYYQLPGNRERGVIKGYGNATAWQTNNQWFSPAFGTASNSNYSTGISLIDTEVTGDWNNSDSRQQPMDHWRLNGATSLVLKDNTGKELQTLNRGQDLDLTSLSENLGKTYQLEFNIDTNIKWVDKNGNQKQALSGKDFERNLEAYWLASELGYQQNSYFINTLALDLQRTVNNGNGSNNNGNNGNNKKITDSDYPTEEYTNTDNKFTLYVTKPNGHILEYLSSSYFWGIPYTNQEVKNIKTGDSGEIKTTTTSENGTTRTTLDLDRTNFGNIFGMAKGRSSDLNDDNLWSAGAYYVARISESEIVYRKNNEYFNARKDLINKDEEKITEQRVNLVGAQVTAQVVYENFLAGNYSSAQIPTTETQTVINDPVWRNAIKYIGVSRTEQSNFAVWGGNPYEIDSSTHRPTTRLKSSVNSTAARFLSDYESDQARIIRAAIPGMINWFNLSSLVYPAGDFEFSAIPYGVFHWNEKDSTGGEDVTKELHRQIYDGVYAPFTNQANQPVYNYGVLPRSPSELVQIGLGLK
ncbi:conserved hypothetical protein [Malacoplasma penetrans HF-2]|uniref:Uncharacterized protein n=1 Tax=Malacoplasma penetrans (strain HF-2) TaxID=272633 RepID=Q8EVK7_MALP2|nr:MG321/MPN456 family lipoprotein [Malacoplasma penetrans]BAC44346.1 conserved hypothetical protein [Malacoplasma penetrans HF-2]